MNNCTSARTRLDCLRLLGTSILLTALLMGSSFEAAGIIIRHDREARWRSFQFNVEPEPPHHLGPIGMRDAQPVPNVRAATVLRTDRAAHAATLTASGTVVITGGLEADESIELFDPVRNEVRKGGSMLHTRAAHTATLLADGSIFIAGGHGGVRGGYRAEAELYDPVTGRSRPTGPLLEPRTDHTATVLDDGRVLLVGGTSTGWTFLATAEVYNPETGESERVGSMSVPRLGHTATLLEDGRVLVVGGYQGRRAAQVLHHTAEIYNPRTRAFASAGRTATARRKHDAVRLADGRVLIHGGSDVTDQVLHASTEIYDPASGRFVAGPEMNNGRFKHRGTSVRFDDGRVLIAAGARRAELFDPVGNMFREVPGDFGSAHFFATATPLPDGDVIIVGGYDSSIRRSAQVWRYAVE